MVDGEILGNTCNNSGGGVWHEGHLKCQAAQSQKILLVRVGVYCYSGRFNQLGGKISGNTADIDKTCVKNNQITLRHYIKIHTTHKVRFVSVCTLT